MSRSPGLSTSKAATPRDMAGTGTLDAAGTNAALPQPPARSTALRHLRAALKLHRRVLTDPDGGRVRAVCAICWHTAGEDEDHYWDGFMNFPCPTYTRIQKALRALDAPVASQSALPRRHKDHKASPRKP